MDRDPTAMRRAIWARLNKFWQSHGIDGSEDAIRLLDSRHATFSKETVRRWAKNEEVPLDITQPRTKALLEQLLAIASIPGEKLQPEAISIVEDWEDWAFNLNRSRKGQSKASEGQSDSVESWVQIIPKQPGRGYATIDKLFVRVDGSTIAGVAERAHPIDEAGLRWHLLGHKHEDAVFFTFRPEDANRDVSDGSAALLATPDRPKRYAGNYSRLVRSEAGLSMGLFRIEWATRVPSVHMPRVALLDLDNTLVKGWSLLSWARSIEAEDLEGIDELRSGLDSGEARYREGQLTHDAFAIESAGLLARMASMNAPEAIDKAAEHYVSRSHERRVFPYTSELIRVLWAHDVAPILVTGAPDFLARPIAARLGIKELHALQVANGTVVHNTGTAAGKRGVLGSFDPRERAIVFGAGDSASDLPIVSTATCAIVTEGLDALIVDGPEERLVVNANSTAQQISAWASSVLPAPLFTGSAELSQAAPEAG